MDKMLLKALPNMDQTNGTQPDFSPNVLNTLIPGYSIISHYAYTFLGIDISIFVTIGALLLAITKGGKYLLDQFEAAFRYLFLSSVYIDDGDDLFDMVMSWLDARETTSNHRNIRAKTPRGSQVDEDDTSTTAPSEALSDSGLFDYKKWSARTPPRYEPYYGRHLIWHAGQPFLLKRSRRPAQQTMQITYGRNDSSEDTLQLDCLGRSPAPIKALLRDIKASSIARKRHITTIRHPTPRERARWGGAWSKTAARPSRPLSTVILAAEQKAAIVKDMNEFLHPSAAGWYARRGIPYRRGYLFHGPPGTGKTSLSFALAGLFGLDVFAVSLQEPALTEGDLMLLFNGLPRRCVVLLEDVDAAGLLLREGEGGGEKKSGLGSKKKEGKGKVEEDGGEKKKDEGMANGEKDGVKEKKQDPPAAAESYTLADLAKELKSLSATSAATVNSTSQRGHTRNNGNNSRGGPQGHPNKEPGSGISLSGLLNAIDGVASHEGRVLIMTSNHPEKLDAALVRPGRVDRKVGFSLAMKAEVRELFVRMYRVGEEDDGNAGSKHASSPVAGENGPSKRTLNGHIESICRDGGFEDAEIDGLDELAKEFADKIPDDTFTPAEIQNHLMRYKNEPRVAIATAEEWKRGVLEEKEKQLQQKNEDDEEGTA